MKDYDVVLVVPLGEEFAAVQDVFEIKERIRTQNLQVYELSTGDDIEYDVGAILLNGMGNPTAAVKTERVLSLLGQNKSRLIVLVGIAGRLDDDFDLCDVIVANRVINYGVRSKVKDKSQSHNDDNETAENGVNDTGSSESGDDDLEADRQISQMEEKILRGQLEDMSMMWEGGGKQYPIPSEVVDALAEFKHREQAYDEWETTMREVLENRIPPEEVKKLIEQSEKDLGNLRDSYSAKTEATQAPIASGELVVDSVNFSNLIGFHDRNLALVEMEAAGVMASVSRTDYANAIIVRGISDLADGDKGQLEAIEDFPWRFCAAQAAVSFVKQFLTTDLVDLARPELPPAKPVEIPELSSNNITPELISVDGHGPATNYIRHYLARNKKRKDRGYETMVSMDLSLTPAHEIVISDIRTDFPNLPELDPSIEQIIADDRVFRKDYAKKQLTDYIQLDENEQTRLQIITRSEKNETRKELPDVVQPIITIELTTEDKMVPVYSIYGELHSRIGFRLMRKSIDVFD